MLPCHKSLNSLRWSGLELDPCGVVKSLNVFAGGHSFGELAPSTLLLLSVFRNQILHTGALLWYLMLCYVML